MKKKRIKEGCIGQKQLDLFYDFLDIQKDMQEQAQELSVNPICNTSLQMTESLLYLLSGVRGGAA